MTEKEKTAPVVSVGADTEQSILKQTNNSITDFNEFDKSLDNYLEEMQKFSYDTTRLPYQHRHTALEF